jgi:dephospho-CoA kinase
VVDCAEETQIRRVQMRNGLDEAQIRAILAAQASRADRLAIANDVINNDGDLASLAAQVERLHERYLRDASKRR